MGKKKCFPKRFVFIAFHFFCNCLIAKTNLYVYYVSMLLYNFITFYYYHYYCVFVSEIWFWFLKCIIIFIITFFNYLFSFFYLLCCDL